MKYLCLIYDEEKKLGAMPKAESDAFMGEYFGFTEGIKKSGHYLGGNALQPVADRHDRPRPERQGVDDRRAVRRDHGTARRLLPDRGQGPERRDPGRGEDPVLADRQHRGPADHGVRAEAMKYLCLIYNREQNLAGYSKEQWESLKDEYGAFTESIKTSGHHLGGEGLEPTATARTVRVRERQDLDHRRAVRGDQGAARRVLPDRGAGPERRHPGRGEDSLGADGQHRGAADHGVQPGDETPMRDTVDAVYRTESRRVLATLIRLLGDFDLAEEALHDAFIAAHGAVAAGRRAGQSARLAGLGRPLQGDRRHAAPRALRRVARRSWPSVSSSRRGDAAGPGDGRATRRRRGRSAAADLHLLPSGAAARRADRADAARGLRPHDRGDRARVPQHAPPTVAQRIVRAKGKIRDARIPYQVPARADLPERLDSVLHVIYLVFNEGYVGLVGRVADARTTCRARRSGSAACSSSCCPSRRRSGCWR